MSLYVLDTDSLTLLTRGHEAISRHVAALDPGDLALTIITVEETLAGWYAQLRRAKKDDQLLRACAALHPAVPFCAQVRILPFDDQALTRFRALRPTARRVGTNDLPIAAIALTHGAVLVSRHAQDFLGLPGLQLEDWTLS